MQNKLCDWAHKFNPAVAFYLFLKHIERMRQIEIETETETEIDTGIKRNRNRDRVGERESYVQPLTQVRIISFSY